VEQEVSTILNQPNIMKRYLITLSNFWILAVSLLFINDPTYSQCTNTTPFGTVNAPTSGGNIVTITTCVFPGEYNTINNAAAGSSYNFTSSTSSDFLTVRQGTPGGAVLGTGTGSVLVTATASGPLYLHVNTDPSCGTLFACRTSTVECTSCPLPPSCDFLVPFTGNNTITANSGTICDHGGLFDYSNNANGFTTINPVVAGDLVRLTFNDFNTENNFDFVRIYDGVGLGAPPNCNPYGHQSSTTHYLYIRIIDDSVYL
jgi:hypothetical protein